MIGWAVETAIAVTMLLLAVLLLRQPVARLFGPRAAYALWALPALRLILPPLPADTAEVLALGQVGQTSQMMDAIIMQVPLAVAPEALAPADPFGFVVPLLLVLWAGVSALFLLVQWLAYRRFRQRLLAGSISSRPVAPGIEMIESHGADGPMALGLWHRLVVFPADPAVCFRADEQAMALAHELAHHRRGDLIANVAAIGLLGLLWWNPVAWLAYHAFRADQELACDADVLDAAAARGDLAAARQAYGRAIVKAASRRGMAAICHLNPVDILKRRLTMIANPVRSARARRAGALTATVLVVSGLVLTASGRTSAAEVGADVARAVPDAQVSALLAAAVAPPAPPAPAAPPVAVAPPAPPVPSAPSLPAEAESPPTVLRKGQLMIINRDGKRIVMRSDRDMTLAEAERRAADRAERAAARAMARAEGERSAAELAAERAEAEAEAAADRAEAAAEQWRNLEVVHVEACERGAQPVSTREESFTKNGITHRRMYVAVCEKELAAQARASALAGLAHARAELDAMPARIRADVRRSIESAMKALREEQN